MPRLSTPLVFLLLILNVYLPGEATLWTRALEQQAGNDSEQDAGERYLAQALSSFSMEEVDAVYTTLSRIVTSGWYEPDDQAELFLRNYQRSASLAAKASYDSNFIFPPIIDPQDPLPDSTRIEALGLLMLSYARKWEEEGALGRAALAVTQVMAIGEKIRLAEEQPVSVTLIGVRLHEISLPLIQSLLSKKELPKDSLRMLGKALDSLDYTSETIAEPLIKDVPINLETVEQRADALVNNGELKAQLAASSPGRLKVYEAFVATEQGQQAAEVIERVASEVETVYTLPYYERPKLNQPWFLDRIEDPILAEVFASQLPKQEQLVYSEVVRARLDLLRIAVGFRYGIRELYRDVADPFSGRQFRAGPGRLYSIGPDGLDQGGDRAYDFTRGAYSPGDIVLPLIATE